jgi:hypothetical protein
MVKSLNLGLKVKVLGPLFVFMGVGGPARAQAKVKGVTVGGWVGGPASPRATTRAARLKSGGAGAAERRTTYARLSV